MFLQSGHIKIGFLQSFINVQGRGVAYKGGNKFAQMVHPIILELILELLVKSKLKRSEMQGRAQRGKVLKKSFHSYLLSIAPTGIFFGNHSFRTFI